MISEGSSDTDDWSNYRLLKIQLCIIAISNSNCNNISQYDCFTVFLIIRIVCR